MARLRGHLPLPAVGQEPRCLVERQPACLRDLDPHLLLDLPEPSAPRSEQEEADDLEDTPAAATRVRVLHVAELFDESALDAGLLEHLTHGRLRRCLSRREVPLPPSPH